MDYEKKYKDALEKARQIHDADRVSGIELTTCEEIFPELAESEDERIRKWLIEMVEEVRKANPTNAEHNGRCSKAIAWFEKQGESDETKAKMFLINKGYPIDVNGKFPTYEEMYYIIKDGIEKQGEQKPAWSDEDESRLDIIFERIERGLIVDKDDIDRLKSLKERYTWKPSDEQLEALEHSLGDYNITIFEDRFEMLKSLYQDLKKLREE